MGFVNKKAVDKSILLKCFIRFVENIQKVCYLKEETTRNLIKICKQESRHVPLFVVELVREIEAWGLAEEGIYRKCGLASQLQQCRPGISTYTY